MLPKNLVMLKINYSFYCVLQVHGLILYTFKQEKYAPVKYLANLTIKQHYCLEIFIWNAWDKSVATQPGGGGACL